MRWPSLAFVDSAETRPAVRLAYRTLVWDGIFAQSMATLITGPFFTAYVLALGASTTLVGVLNAAAPLAQVLQWPAAGWVANTTSWRRVTVVTAAIGRSAWFAAALLPWFAPHAWRLPLLLGFISIHFLMNGVTCCAFNAWMRALIPESTAGHFFGHRSAWAIMAGVAAGLLAGIVVQRAELAGNVMLGYSLCIAGGTTLGWVGLFFLQATPDAPRTSENEASRVTGAGTPVAVYQFLALWSFALNLVQPFVAVYLLRALGLNVAWTMVLMMTAQGLNACLAPVWGRLADRFSNRAVLRVLCSASAAGFLLWPAAAHLPAGFVQTAVTLAAIFGGGAAQTGATLCCYLLTLKSAPTHAPTHGVAKGNGVAGIAALTATALGGWLADQLDALGALQGSGATGLDAVFIAAAVLGMGSVAVLNRVPESGRGGGRDVLRALFGAAT